MQTSNTRVMPHNITNPTLQRCYFRSSSVLKTLALRHLKFCCHTDVIDGTSTYIFFSSYKIYIPFTVKKSRII